jgi:hypothetical protein
MTDNVNNPKHYNNHPSGIECIQVTEHMNFNLGNAIKYLWRTDHKNGVEDLKKAAWYINREIQKLENQAPYLKSEKEKIYNIKEVSGNHMTNLTWARTRCELIQNLTQIARQKLTTEGEDVASGDIEYAYDEIIKHGRRALEAWDKLKNVEGVIIEEKGKNNE